MKSYSDKMSAPMKFGKMKLSQYFEGDSFDVIGIQGMSTKFGKTYVLLLDNDDRVFSNKTITTYIEKNWDLDHGMLQFDVDEGAAMFSFSVGESAEFNGHQYNKISIKATLN